MRTPLMTNSSLLGRLTCTAVFMVLAGSQSSAFAQTSVAGANWERVKSLPQNTRLHVSADHMGHTCRLSSVSDTELVCGKQSFPRAQVKTVKLTRYGTSYGAGAAIAGAAGAGIGVALVSADTFFQNDKGKAAGIGAVLGAILGALISGPADLFRGPTVYRRP